MIEIRTDLGPLRLRVASPGDLDFSRRVYVENRAAELAGLTWPEAMKMGFLDQQFRLQTSHFDHAYPAADRWIVTRGDAPTGRLYVASAPPRFELIEIGLLPSAQGRGVGSALINWLIARAAAAGADVGLHVARDNSGAARLYERLGFRDAPSAAPTHRYMVRAR